MSKGVFIWLIMAVFMVLVFVNIDWERDAAARIAIVAFVIVILFLTLVV